jgi:hypothetical protein
MDEHQRLAEQFEAQRTRMRALAYRMLGFFALRLKKVKLNK